MKRSIIVRILLLITAASFIVPCGCNKNSTPATRYPELPDVSIPAPAEQLLQESETFPGIRLALPGFQHRLHPLLITIDPFLRNQPAYDPGK